VGKKSRRGNQIGCSDLRIRRWTGRISRVIALEPGYNFSEYGEMNIFQWNKGIQLLRALLLFSVFLSAAHAASDFYQQRNLVSDGAIAADNKDGNLINGWGIAFNPTAFVWVADNGTGVATLYDGAGKPQSLVVQIPAPANMSGRGNPTGIVFNGSSEFVVSQGQQTGPSRFIFATEDGVIAGWAPNVDATHAIRVVDNSKTSGAIYKGLALSAAGNGSRLYAADFHNNKVDVFDAAFKPVSLASDAFADATLPAGFAPFGIQAINGDIYVAYAKQDDAKEDEVRGQGLGYINVFDPNGRLIRRVASQGMLNAPWGIALAPAGFGKFSNRLLVGNFGDGTINAYDVATGDFVGQLQGTDGKPLQIDGLWGIAFGNGFQNQSVNTLFFAAGPGDEKQGLYGRIDVAGGNNSTSQNGQQGGQQSNQTPSTAY
jgi:uncharacterized protein (TIGR03118 family)